MAFQGIDISNWQNGINLQNVPADFVIIKATQGTGYISPDFERQINQAFACGKYVGVYHYVNGAGAAAEARHFYNIIKPYLNKVIICTDWEKEQNSQWGNLNYLDQFMKEINALTSIPTLLYASQSGFPWSTASNNNGGTWVAQYANFNTTGYQETPWNEGAYNCTIRQYSSAGRLPGWGGNLDLNKAYITKEMWMEYANPSGKGDYIPNPTPANPTIDNMDLMDLVAETMMDKYGKGQDRERNLGSRYQEVQNMINYIMFTDAKTLADEVWTGKYGNGSKRKNILGPRWDEVMSVVNGGGSTGRVYTVQSGDTLSSIAAKFGTTYQHIAQINGLSNPNLIYPGQRLRID